MVEQTAFASGRTTFLDLTPEPLVVVHRTRQKVESDLIDCAPGLRGEACESRFEFGRNLQVHEASVGRIQSSVNFATPRDAAALAGVGEPEGRGNGSTALGLDLRAYDVSPDGQRFLMIKEND